LYGAATSGNTNPKSAATDYGAIAPLNNINTNSAGGFFLFNLNKGAYTGYPLKNGNCVGCWGQTNVTITGLKINLVTPITSISDGTSNTILVVEASGRPNTCRVGTGCDANGVQNGIGAWATPNNVIHPSGALFDGSNGPGPCTMNCNNGSSSGVGNIYSGHTDGCNFLFADGSVHFISQTITWKPLAALMTDNWGDANDPTWY